MGGVNFVFNVLFKMLNLAYVALIKYKITIALT